MTIDQLLAENRLADAITHATNTVRDAPRNVNARIALFELLAADGQWERAAKQLALVPDHAPELSEATASYGGILAAERRRAALFASGEGTLDRIIEPSIDATPFLEAIRAQAAGDAAGAQARLAEGAQRLPETATIDGAPADGFGDGDDVLAPWLEVISRGQYGWIPFVDLAWIEFDAPRYLRDLLWRPASLALPDGGSLRVFVPARYAGSEASDDPQVKLGRVTDWTDGAGPVRGIGQRAFVAGDEMYPILDVTRIDLTGESA